MTTMTCVHRLRTSCILIAGVVLACSGVARAQAAPSASTKVSNGSQATPSSLLAQARAYEQRNRMDLATQMWLQALEGDPRNTEALGGLARAAAMNGNAPLAQMYLDRLRAINPNDPNIAAVQKIKPGSGDLNWRQPEPAVSMEAAAYQALNSKHIAEAERRFKAILAKQPGDAGALAGMGFVRMQQRNFLGAVTFFERAKQKRPRDKSIATALDTARFWFIVDEGQHSLSAGDVDTAEKRFRSALQLRPDAAEPLAGLGDTLLRQGNAQQALPIFERVVTAKPELPQGWRGLVAAQYASGSPALALETDQRSPAAIHAELMRDPGYLLSLGSSYAAVGRSAEAEKTLAAADALSSGAESKATKAAVDVQLAAVLLATKQPARAEELCNRVLASDPENPGAWDGLIRAQQALGRQDAALAIFDRMPAGAKEKAMSNPQFDSTVASLYESTRNFDQAQNIIQKAIDQQAKSSQSASASLQVQLARVYVEKGQPQLGYPIYQQVLRGDPGRADAWAGLLLVLHLTGHDNEAATQLTLIPASARAELDRDPNYLQTIAAVYASQGRAQEATQLLGRAEQDYAAESVAPPADVQIENAWLLYKGLDDAGLYRQLMTLGARHDLTTIQRRTVQTIWAQWSLRRANQAAAEGNTSRALAILNAASQSFADNPAALRTVAAGYVQAGQPQQAVVIYKAQDMTAASAQDYQAAIGAALVAADTKSAEIWLRYALAKYPKDAQILLLGAQYEQARGDTTRAMRYYQQSLKSMPAQPAANAPGAQGPSPALPGGNQAQDLGTLLAPSGTLPAPAVAAPPKSSGEPVASPAPPVPFDSSAAVTPPGTPPGSVGSVPAQTAAAPPTETYGAYVPYIAPPAPTPVPNIDRANGSGPAVPVQLGNAAAPPTPQRSEMTDVLPTPSALLNSHSNPNFASDPNAAAAQADRVRRAQNQAAADRPAQAKPVPRTTPQVAQPAAAPREQVDVVSDAGTQQYPQPRNQPRNIPQVPVPQPGTSPEAQAASAEPPPAPATPPAEAPVAPAAPPEAYVPQPTVPPHPPTDAELAAQNLPALRGLYGAQVPMNQQQQVQHALSSLEGLYSGWLGGTGLGRFRSGTAGLDRLSDIEAPVEASVVFGQTARLTAIAEPVFLNSGVFSAGSAPVTIPYLGRLPSGTTAAPAQQFSNGVGGELQLSTKDFGIAAGYTPYEFLVRNFTARLRWSPFPGHLTLFGDRSPVKDTQLSYAGLRDPAVSTVVGPVWGGVIATTGGVELTAESAATASGFYLTGEGGVLKGRHVLDNTRYGGSAGAYFRVAKWAGAGAGTVTVGGSAIGLHYEHNEVGLSYGQGGYFSPGYYVQVAAPVTLQGASRSSNFHYTATAAFGVRTFRQDMAPIFPLDATLQGSFSPCGTSGVQTYSCGYYPALVTTGFNYSVNSEVAYLVADHWFAGGFVTANNTYNYDNVAVGFFFRYTFRKQAESEGRPTGLFPQQGLRPLQVP